MPLIYGVDLGAHAVKLAVLDGNFGRYQVKGYHQRVLSQDGEGIPSFTQRMEALQALVEEQGAPSNASRPLAAAAWPAESASVRLVRLPFGDRAQVEKTLPFEVEGLVPFDLDETTLAHRVLRVAPDGSEVLAAMASTQALTIRTQALKAAGLDPTSLCVDADLLGNFADSGVQAILDLGHVRTLAAVAVEGKVHACRAITGGGRDLTLALMRAFRLTWAEAEARKHRTSLLAREGQVPSVEAIWEEEEVTAPTAEVPVSAVDDAAVLRKAVAPLLHSIRATLISFEDGLGTEIDEILLAGGGADLEGLREILSEELGVPVRRAYVAEGIATTYALAHQLSRKAAKLTYGRELDMRQGGLAFQGDLVNLGILLRVGALAAVAMMVVGMGWFVARSVQLNRSLSALESQIAQEVKATFPEMSDAVAKNPTTALAAVTEETMSLTQRVESMSSILADEPPTLTLLRKVADGVPPHGEARLDVEEMTITRTAITFSAETDSYEDATSTEAALQQVPGFRSAKKGDESKNRQDKIDFKITIPLETSAEETEEG